MKLSYHLLICASYCSATSTTTTTTTTEDITTLTTTTDNIMDKMDCEDFCVDHCSGGYCEKYGWYDQCYNGCMNSCPEWRPDFYTCYDWGAGNCIHLDLSQFFDCKDCYIEGCCAVDCQYSNK